MVDTILREGKIELVPFEENDFEYLFSLAKKYRYNLIRPEEFKAIRHSVEKHGKYFWTGRVEGEKGAVLYLSYYPQYDWWTFDAYKDDEKAKELAKRYDRKADFSYRAAQLVMDYFFSEIGDTLHTIHDHRSRGANILCRRLGFKEVGRLTVDLGEFIVFRKERKSYGA